MAGSPDPRPPARVVADVAALRDHVIGTGAYCAGCDAYYSAARMSVHHLVPRSLGGDDVLDNLVPLCGDGTVGCHGRYENRAPGWELVAASVRRYATRHARKRRYVLATKGADFFDRYYPRGF